MHAGTAVACLAVTLDLCLYEVRGEAVALRAGVECDVELVHRRCDKVLVVNGVGCGVVEEGVGRTEAGGVAQGFTDPRVPVHNPLTQLGRLGVDVAEPDLRGVCLVLDDGKRALLDAALWVEPRLAGDTASTPDAPVALVAEDPRSAPEPGVACFGELAGVGARGQARLVERSKELVVSGGVEHAGQKLAALPRCALEEVAEVGADRVCGVGAEFAAEVGSEQALGADANGLADAQPGVAFREFVLGEHGVEHARAHGIAFRAAPARDVDRAPAGGLRGVNLLLYVEFPTI